MRRFFKIVTFLALGASFLRGDLLEESDRLFEDLSLVEEVNRSLKEDLPFLYNDNLMIGYLSMPSARMNAPGMLALGGGTSPSHTNYGLNFQFLTRVELSANYRVYNDLSPSALLRLDLPSDTARVGNIKLGIILPQDGLEYFPSISIGANDFFASSYFHSQYIVATKNFLDFNLEVSLGVGRKGIPGLFGGFSWTPFRQTKIPFIKNLSLIGEFDPSRDFSQQGLPRNKINAGIAFVGLDTFQVTCSSRNGKDFALSASLRYPLGTTPGFLPKTRNPPLYSGPLDSEPLGLRRTEKEFAAELSHALKEQQLDLFQIFILFSETKERELWIKVVNNTYRNQEVLKERLEKILAALLPENISCVTVLIEADALACFSYQFRKQDLESYRLKQISSQELGILSPMQEAIKAPDQMEAILVFQRKRDVVSFVFEPRILTFFGSSTGKLKYNFSLIASPEGYLFDQVFYKLQARKTLLSSMQKLLNVDPVNPSELPNVRTDSVHYYQNNQIALEEAFLQKSWNLGKGFFSRVAGGYFETAYGGGAAEILYFPVRQNFAIGVEAARIWKRNYTGLGFTTKIRKFNGINAEFIHFIGLQYFLDLHYIYRPAMIDIQLNLGQFLAKDRGGRIELGKTYPNGVRLGLWLTVTNGHDRVNGRIYHDKGFVFSIPLDFFLKKSHRSYVGYAMSAWLRDVGAQAETGKKLWTTLSEERFR